MSPNLFFSSHFDVWLFLFSATRTMVSIESLTLKKSLYTWLLNWEAFKVYPCLMSSCHYLVWINWREESLYLLSKVSLNRLHNWNEQVTTSHLWHSHALLSESKEAAHNSVSYAEVLCEKKERKARVETKWMEEVEEKEKGQRIAREPLLGCGGKGEGERQSEC